MKDFIINFGFYNLFGFNLASWFGIIAIILFMVSAIMAKLILKGKLKMSLKSHGVVAFIALVFALIHAFIFIFYKFS